MLLVDDVNFRFTSSAQAPLNHRRNRTMTTTKRNPFEDLYGHLITEALSEQDKKASVPKEATETQFHPFWRSAFLFWIKRRFDISVNS